MEITPALRATRFSQLKPGELFLYSHENGVPVAIAPTNPVQFGDLSIVTLGPKFPPTIDGPTIHSPQNSPGHSSVLLSYGSDYVLRLPVRSQAWSSITPPAHLPCVAVAQEEVCIRTNAGPPGQEFRPCYVAPKEGKILGSGDVRKYFELRDPIFALEWEIVTAEEKTRTILGCPFA
jgi:hypothetical protein